MVYLTVTLLLIYLLTPEVLSVQERFRSILIERACRKRPTLSFCSDFDLPETPKTERGPKLVLPPVIDIDAVPPPAVSSTSPQPRTPIINDQEVDFDNKNETDIAEEERLGSLIKLPKPKKSQDDLVEPVLPKSRTSSDVSQAINVGNSNITPVSIEDENTVLVFVSEYCVVHRERFVRNCHEEVAEEEVPFCKTYPSVCAPTNGVIPVLTYCQRYYKHYPKACSGPKIAQEFLQFCFAFEQFCLPELTHAEAAEKPKTTVEHPKTSLRRCEDVLPEARKVCNPFPHPKDTFNVLRCSNFLTNCRKFVDWV